MRKQIDIHDRLLAFGISIVKLCKLMARSLDNRVIADQLIRSGTSVGANLQEADAAASKKDFIHKLTIAKKECQETNYWLKLVKGSDLLHHETSLNELDRLLQESHELVLIIGSILAKTKANLQC